MLKNTVLNTGSTFLYFFLQWLTTVLAVRWSNFETAGVFAMAVSFTNIFYYIAVFGIRNYQISDVEEKYSQEQYAGARLVAILVAAVGFFCMAWVSRLDRYTISCYGMYMIFKLGEAYSEGFFAVAQKEGRYGILSSSMAVKGLLSVGMFAAALNWTHSLLAAIAAMVVGYGLAILIVDAKYLYATWKGIRIKGCGGILIHCTPLLLISLSVPLMNYATRYAVEQQFSYYYVGQYSSLSSVIVVLATLGGAVFVVFIPEISKWRIQGETTKIRKIFLSGIAAIAAIGVVAMLAGKLLGAFVCSLIFGEEIMESIDLLVPLLLTATMLMIKSYYSAILVAMEKRGHLLAGEYCGCIFCVLTAKFFTKEWGMWGTNLSYLFGVIVQGSILCVCIQRAIRTMGQRLGQKQESGERME